MKEKRIKQPDEFIRLFLENQHRLLAFTSTLVPTLDDAEDILQEASTVMWDKFDTFEVGTNYTAWAFRIIRFKVMEWRRKHQRVAIIFDDDLLWQISEDAIAMDSFHELTFTALSECVNELPERQQLLVRSRYRPKGTMKEAAKAIGRSVVTTRKYLNQILDTLLECVNRKVGAGGDV